MANPKGINQYTRHGAGALRTKTGHLFHGTTVGFVGSVKPADKRNKAWATTDIKQASQYANSTRDGAKGHRLLQVALPVKGGNFFARKGSGAGNKALASTRPLTVVRSIKLLKHRK